jgi:antitoxin component YwqK of YwqJK toxin-antitoxin module
MKKLIVLFLFISSVASAQTSVLYDTVYSNNHNEGPNVIVQILRSEGMLKDSLKIGPWKTYYQNKQISDAGEYLVYNKNSIRFSFMDASYTDVDTNAIKKTFKEIYSLPVGEWNSYYTDGKLESKGNYLPVAILVISPPIEGFNEQGELQTYVSYTSPEAMKTGIWEHYDEKGELESKETYVKGILITTVYPETK